MVTASIGTDIMEKHQFVGILVAICVSLSVFVRDGANDETLARVILVFAGLIPILIYRIIAYFSGFGFMESFASDYGSKNDAGPYAFFFWLVFLVICLFQIFKWSFY